MERIAKAITTTLCRKASFIATDHIEAAAEEWFAADVRTIHWGICHTKTSLRCSSSGKNKASASLLAGRTDGVQPRFLEILHSWGLAAEVHEEGPLIERTAICRDGRRLLFNTSHQSDSRYRGLHIITQGQLERIHIRDLLRHQVLVERETLISDFEVESDSSTTHPLCLELKNDRTGANETVRAKFLVGSDGAASTVRRKLQIPFDEVSTDIF
ncbi:hypothetical protein MMC22_007627 [Lobaria immixta]|nr:hypothetical protein [Lobaria immixta]